MESLTQFSAIQSVGAQARAAGAGDMGTNTTETVPALTRLQWSRGYTFIISFQMGGKHNIALGSKGQRDAAERQPCDYRHARETLRVRVQSITIK